VPTFLYQVRGEFLTDPSDVQAMFNNIPVAEKKLHWIEGSTTRWHGYMEFQRRAQFASGTRNAAVSDRNWTDRCRRRPTALGSPTAQRAKYG
jgi:hypothetical protein